MSFTSTIIYWNLEEKRRVNFFVKTHNQNVKQFGGTINEVRNQQNIKPPDLLKFRSYSLLTNGTVFA